MDCGAVDCGTGWLPTRTTSTYELSDVRAVPSLRERLDYFTFSVDSTDQSTFSVLVGTLTGELCAFFRSTPYSATGSDDSLPDSS